MSGPSKPPRASASSSQEFTGVLFAGLGGNLSPLSNTENLPKALLPVANRALISYPLSWLERAGVASVIILCLDGHESAISTWLRSSWKSSIKPSLISASSEDLIEGSADALRTLLADKKDQIKGDVILISCDSICEIPPFKLLDFHRLADASVTSIFYRQPSTEIMSAIKKGSKTFTGYEESSNTLLYTNSEADIEDEIELRTSMVWKYPRVTLTTQLNDLHIYIVKRWVLDLITTIPELSRINTDLLPLLCKSQFQSLLRTKYSINQAVEVKLYIPDPEDFCARLNTRQTYLDLNRHLMKSLTPDSRISRTSTIGERSNVGTDSALGSDSSIDEKSTIKRSCIASNVTIGKMCRISGCVIMDHVTIKDGVKLENCVVCTHVVIGEKSSFKDCTIGGKVSVPDKTEAKGEDRVVGGEISMGV